MGQAEDPMDDTPAERLAARGGMDLRRRDPSNRRHWHQQEIQALEETYRVSETRGDPHVVVRGQPVPIDAVPSVLAEERARTAAAIQEQGGVAGGGESDNGAKPVA